MSESEEDVLRKLEELRLKPVSVSESKTWNKRADILQTAENLINGDRAQSYGPPERSFSRIAALWTAMGMGVLAQGPAEGDRNYRDVNATDVALALIQLKASRLTSSPDHEDSWVDIAGYAGLGGEIALSGVRESGLKEEVKLDTVNFNQVTYFKPTAENYGYVVCSDCDTCCRREEVALHAKKSHGKTAYILDRPAADAFVSLQIPNPRPFSQISFTEIRHKRAKAWQCDLCHDVVVSEANIGPHADYHKATMFTIRLS